MIWISVACDSQPAARQPSAEEQAAHFAAIGDREFAENHFSAAIDAYCQASELHPSNAEYLARWAKAGIAAQDLSQAILPATRATALQPENGRYRALMGDVQSLAINRQAANQEWRRALELDPELHLTRLRVASSRHGSTQAPFESKIEETEYALAYLFEEGEALYDRGECLSNADRGQEAEGYFRLAADANPPSIRAFRALANRAIERSDYLAARQSAQEAFTRSPEDYRNAMLLTKVHALFDDSSSALTVCRVGLKFNVRELALHAYKIWALIRQNRADEALEEFEYTTHRIWNFCRSEVQWSDRESASSILTTLRDRVLAHGSEEKLNWGTQLSLAMIDMICGGKDCALNHAQRLTRIRPGNPDAYRILGIVLDALNRRQEAEEAWRQSLLRAPEDARTLAIWGSYLEAADRNQEAEPFLRRAIQNGCDSAFIKFRLGEALFYQKKDLDEAQRLLLEARAQEPTSNGSAELLARIAMERGEFVHALAYSAEALRIRPWDEQSLFYFGKALYESGRIADSIAIFDVLLRGPLDDDDHGIYLGNRAQSLRAIRQPELAIKDLQEAVNLNPNNTWLRRSYTELLAEMAPPQEAKSPQ